MPKVKQVKQDNDVFDINDARIPEATNFDIGKTPIVQADGTFVFGEAGTQVVGEGGSGWLTGLQIGDNYYSVGALDVEHGTNQYGVPVAYSFYDYRGDGVFYTDSEYNLDFTLNGNPIILTAVKAMSAKVALNYGLQVLGLEERVNHIIDFVEIWDTYKENPNYTFLLMGLFLASCNEVGIEIKDTNRNAIKYIINIDKETPTNSNFTEYVLTEDTSNGYELKYVGTHYTIADTATIMTWTLQVNL